MLKKFSRRQFLKTASIVTVGGIAAACSTPTPTTAPAVPTVPPEAPAATDIPATKPEATAEPKPAATTAPTALPEVQLRFMLPASPVPEDTTPFDKLNEITKARIGATVTYEVLDWSVFGDKQSLYHSSGEPVDIEFAAPWLPENFVNPAANGVYTALDDLLPKYAPNIWKTIVDEWWRAVTVNGKIYAVINEQYFPKPWGFKVRADMIDKYKINLDAITDYDSEEMFRLLHALGDPDKENLDYPWAQTYPSGQDIWGYDPIASAGAVSIAVGFDDKNRKVVNWHETPEYMRFAKMMKRLSDEGLSKHDPLKVAHDQSVALNLEGKIRFAFVIQNRPGTEAQSDAETKAQGYTWKHKTIAPVRLSTGSISATLLAIPAVSKNPERALMFMDLLGSDAEFYNLLAFGIEGKHWNWVDKTKKLIKQEKDIKYDLHGNGWMFVNQFLEYYLQDGWPVEGMWDIQGHYQNMATKSSVMIGFVPNPKEYEDKSTLLASGGADAFTQKIDGADGDPEKNVADLIAWEKQNGVDDVVAKIQKQVDTWAKTL